MIYYDGIDVTKSSASKECIICHYWCFLGKRFMYQLSFCNMCHDVLMMYIDLDSIAMLNIRGID